MPVVPHADELENRGSVVFELGQSAAKVADEDDPDDHAHDVEDMHASRGAEEVEVGAAWVQVRNLDYYHYSHQAVQALNDAYAGA